MANETDILDVLGDAQLARAKALAVAKETLTGTGALFSGVTNERGTGELIDIAEYVLRGPKNDDGEYDSVPPAFTLNFVAARPPCGCTDCVAEQVMQSMKVADGEPKQTRRERREAARGIV